MKNKKFITFIIIGAIVACLGGYLYISSQNNSQSKAPKLINLELEESLIKLSDESSYMKTNIVLGYNEKAKDIEAKVPIIRDTVIQYFMSKSTEDFKHDNLDNMKKELISKINKNLGSDAVKEVYFTNLVVQ